MNCNLFRFLVQQRFDTEISPQDDRALLIHLETCESCQKFHHQVQQVILASEELPIQDDLLPIKLESLARRIMQDLPEPKNSVIETMRLFLTNFGNKSNGAEKVPTQGKAVKNKSQSRFPHINRHRIGTEEKDDNESSEVKKLSAERLEEMRTAADKLKAFGKTGQDAIIDSRESQSTTRSLSEKFGMQTSSSNNIDDAPLTLADSIRRKLSESQRLTNDQVSLKAEASKSQETDVWGKPASPPPVNPDMKSPSASDFSTNSVVRQEPMQASIGFDPNDASVGQSVLGAWGKPSPIDSAQWGKVANPNSSDGGFSNPSNNLPGFSQLPDQTDQLFVSPSNREVQEYNDASAGFSHVSSFSPEPAIDQNSVWGNAVNSSHSPQDVNTAPHFNAADSNQKTPFESGFLEAPKLNDKPDSPWGKPAPKSPTFADWQEAPSQNESKRPAFEWSPESNVPAADTTAPPTAPSADKNIGSAWESAFSQGAQATSPKSSWSNDVSPGDWQKPIQVEPTQEQPQDQERLEELSRTSEGANWDKPSSAPTPLKKPNWSNEAEQIETGTWQAYYPSDALGAQNNQASGNKEIGADNTSTPATSSPVSSTPEELNQDWLQSVQEKLARQRENASASGSVSPDIASTHGNWSAPPPKGAQPLASRHISNETLNNFDFATQSLSGLANSVMDKLGSMLGEKHNEGTSAISKALSTPAPLESVSAPQSSTQASPANQSNIDLWEKPTLPAPPPSPSEISPPIAKESAIQKGEPRVEADAERAKSKTNTLVNPAITVSLPVMPQLASSKDKSNSDPIVSASEPLSVQLTEPLHTPRISPVTSKKLAPLSQEITPVLPSADESPSDKSKRQRNSGLFVLNDKDIDKLFSENLGVNEIATPTSTNVPSESATSQAARLPSQMMTKEELKQTIPETSQFSAKPPSRSKPSIIPAVAKTPIGEPSLTTQESSANKSPTSDAPDVCPSPDFWQSPSSQATDNQSAPSNPAQRSPEPGANKTPGSERLFSLDSNIIDRIFTDNLGVSEQAQSIAKISKLNVNEVVKEISDIAASNPSRPSAAAPRIEGLGRLDSRIDTGGDIGSGRIASIGKFLLDGKDLEKIGKITNSDPADTKMRILTLEGAAELNAMLQQVGAQPGVVGSVIIGHDGLLIANTMPPDLDAELFGVISHSLFMSTLQTTGKMGSEKVHQIVAKTTKGYLIIADFGNGLLVTITDVQSTESLIPLMHSITELVAP